MKNINITGQKFGRLTAIKRLKPVLKNKRITWCWLFKCDCGKIKIIRKHSVTSGHAKSCGCFGKEQRTKPTHGMSKTRFYQTWSGLLNRCNDPKRPFYHRYGGRGIKCLWKSFEEFRDDMYESYLEHVKQFGKKQTSIDRKNNNGNYCKKNCRWATLKEQNRNTKQNRFITFRGETKCLAEWARIINIKQRTLRTRVNLKWPIEKALTTPLLRQSKF